MSVLKLHNTLTRKKEDFVPIDNDHVRVYACGPTVYGRIHVGNARPIVVFDVLVRLLRLRHAKVTYVRNITDVDDKINIRAAERGIGIDELCAETIETFYQDTERLGALAPDIEPRATHHRPSAFQPCWQSAHADAFLQYQQAYRACHSIEMALRLNRA